MSFSSSIQRLAKGLTVPPVELVFTPHSLWPLPRSNFSRRARTLQVAVLDSSFNPPTIAHLGLANAPRPSYDTKEDQDYDAKLLLLSVRNADKQLKPTDATYVQRLEMMVELAKEIVNRNQGEHEDTGNTAVAIIDEPTFVGKSRILQAFLRNRLTDAGHPNGLPQLTFLLGYDTLERLFAPRYYKPPQSESGEYSENDATRQMYAALRIFFAHPPEGDGSRVVCARRSPSSYPQAPASTSSREQMSLTSTIHDFYTSQSLPSECVKMIDIGKDVWNASSSAVRAAISRGDDEWKAMVSVNVREYIVKEGLYK